MARAKLNLQLQHTADKFWDIYRQSTCAVERRRAQFLAFLAEGRSREEAIQLTRYSGAGAIKVIQSYQHAGLQGLRDRREQNKGAPRLLDPQTTAQLLALLQNDHKQGQPWTAKQIQQWVKTQTGKDIYLSRAYEIIAAAGLSSSANRNKTATNKEPSSK